MFEDMGKVLFQLGVLIFVVAVALGVLVGALVF